MNTAPKTVPDRQNLPNSTTTLPRIDSQKILQGANTVEIEHAGQCYRLRVTRENKLILTK